MNDKDIRKARDFVDHLFRNPNIKDEPPLIAEGLLLNFIVQNMDQLKLTFKTPQFFPHLDWNEVLQILLSNMYERISGEIMPLLNRFFENMDYDVINKVNDGSSLPADFHREKFTSFIDEIFKNKDVRYNLNSAIYMLKNNVVENYLTEIFKQRSFLYNEIVRVQKTNLEADEYIAYMKVLLILRNAAHMKIKSLSTGSKNSISLNDALKIPGKFNKFLDDMVFFIRERLPNLDDKTIRLALKSNLKEKMTDLEEASSRLLYVLCTRYHNYKPVGKIDRGAESPDKSWFAVARKNAEYYGFEKRMLDELYRISADNNW